MSLYPYPYPSRPRQTGILSGNAKPEDSSKDESVTDTTASGEDPVDGASDVETDTESEARSAEAQSAGVESAEAQFTEAGSAEAQSAGVESAEAQSAEAGSGAEPAPREPTALERLAAERDQHLNDLQRVTAEFANFRKQTEKRNAQTVQQAAAGVMQAILPVLDACDAAALQHVEGVEPITAQLRSVLEAQGLEIIDQTEPFDPNRHEAAMSEPGDEDQTEPMVSAVLRTGYAFNGRVLRAAMVKVKG